MRISKIYSSGALFFGFHFFEVIGTGAGSEFSKPPGIPSVCRNSLEGNSPRWCTRGCGECIKIHTLNDLKLLQMFYLSYIVVAGIDKLLIWKNCKTHTCAFSTSSRRSSLFCLTLADNLHLYEFRASNIICWYTIPEFLKPQSYSHCFLVTYPLICFMLSSYCNF